MTTISALLLPLGIWLILSAATPKTDENRIAVSGLLTALVASLAFAATGFAFMLGRGMVISISGQAWELLGSSGFLMGGATPSITSLASFARFVPSLSLTLACALLVNSVIAQRVHYGLQAAVSVFVGGVLFPIAGKWVLADGWLAALGRHLNFGHGAVDFGGLATAAWVAGIVGLAFLWAMPRKQAITPVNLPFAQFPFRAVSGVVAVLIGCVVVFGSNLQLGAAADNKAVFNYFITLSVACVVAGLGGLLYSRVTSPQADVLCAARATLAAAIMVSSGAGALPIWVAAALGILAGLLSTVGLYVVHQKLRLDDDSALITSALLPGALGFLTTGLFANGAFGAGWNGVGVSSYLAVSQLGVVGLLPIAASLGDPGQFTAQLIALGSIGAASVLGAGVMAYAIRPHLLRSVAKTPAVEVPSSAAAPQWIGPVEPDRVIEIQPIPVAFVESQPVSIVIQTPLAEETPVLPQPTHPQPEPEAKRVFAAVIPPTEKLAEQQKAEDGLLDRLRRLRRANLPEQPARARKVAYPIRIGGKPLIRPLVEESSSKP